MKKIKSKYTIITSSHFACFGLLFLLLTFQSGCKKYLDEKPIKSQYVPTNLDDLQALLDNNTNLNQASVAGYAELAADNFYVTTADWQTVTSQSGPDGPLNYIWEKNAASSSVWRAPYLGSIYYSNIVLDALNNIPADASSQVKWNAIKGFALFYRAFNFHQLAQLYCRPYSSTAGTDAGIVLKLSSDIQEPIIRSTVQQSYDRIISDVKQSVDLLPDVVTYPTQPNKAAAYGLLARIYLSMRDYTNAGLYANLSLGKNNSLIDYNTLIPLKTPPIKEFNIETIFFDRSSSTGSLITTTRGKVDPVLYATYNIKDLRKTVFFKANTGVNIGTFSFQGSYYGTSGVGAIFDGLTTAEMFLIRGECYARAGKITEAIADLNTLMVKRWKNDGTYVPFTATTADDAKNLILTERRKELFCRGLRWSDIRRLNLEGANISLSRIINSITYTLPANDLRSVLLIPTDVIGFSGISQNPR